MSLRVLAVQKPSTPSSPDSADPPDKTEAARGHIRRRRHTPHNHQDRILRRVSRILIIAGILMVLWLVLNALGWV